MTFSVITYATHPQGKFDQLVADYPSITVGGLGKKWNGFMDKNNFIREYSEAQDPEHIVIYVDGFDTQIVGNVRDAVKRFKRERCRILVSHGTIESTMWRVGRRRIFGVNDHTVANAGLYMGYAKEMTALTRAIEASGESDDQKALNTITHSRNDLCIKIDYDHRVFYNTTFSDRDGRVIDSDAVFLGFNGTLGFDKASVRKVLGYSAQFGPEWMTAGLGMCTGALGPFVFDKSFHCNNLTATFGILFPLMLIPIGTECDNDLYARVFTFCVATMVTFHVSHLVKLRIQRHVPVRG
tara:strand:- start:983 stop:1870 length:888 start_codon:yes stop_codon:yes gene_type:complete